ncbi:hypothetical protein ACFL96_05095 [Thermoproteota archaeon]
MAKIKIDEDSCINTRIVQAQDMMYTLQYDLGTRPFLVVDDPEAGKVLGIALKAPQPDQSPVSYFAGNVRIRPLNNQQYYIIYGDESDFRSPLIGSDEEFRSSPESELKYFAFSKRTQTKKLPQGMEMAKIARRCLEDKVGGSLIGEARPRYCELVLITNPYEENIPPADESRDTHIYMVSHGGTLDQVTLDCRQSIEYEDNIIPAYSVSDNGLWDLYSKKTGEHDTKSMEDKLVCGTAALLEYMAIVGQDKEAFNINPTLIDMVTIPFEPPEGNSSNARYDPSFVVQIYERALDIIDEKNIAAEIKKSKGKTKKKKPTKKRQSKKKITKKKR